MSTTKDSVRPTSQHRLSVSSANRSNAMRPHSHTVSLGSLNPNHRVNRRKSSTSMTGVNRAALVAAIREGSHGGLPDHRPVSHQEGLGISNTHTAAPNLDRSMSASRKAGSAIEDGGPMLSKSVSKMRARRASDGSILKKERRNTNSGGELKCEKCGKGYKHGSCLQKHLWEHTEEWALTSKLLISKHAQVQMLEAASVLVAMNQERNTDSSDTSSQSPAHSGASDPIEEDDDTSSRTSAPSQDDEYIASRPTTFCHPRRQDSYSSVFSRSYGSTAASSLPAENGFHHYWNSGSRPSTAGQAYGQTYAEEQADVTAAAESLLGVSIGTPQFRSSHLSADVPPVPPLPAKFASQAAYSPYMRPQYTPDHDLSDEERRYRMRQAVEPLEDDEGVFGCMES